MTPDPDNTNTRTTHGDPHRSMPPSARKPDEAPILFCPFCRDGFEGVEECPEHELTLLPIDRLTELENAGEIGSSAPSHYSIMGYNMQPLVLLKETVPAIVRNLRDEAVDVVVLVPA